MRRHGNLRYPPGYFIYGLSTYQDIICRRLPFKFMRSAVQSIAFSIIDRILTHCQGLYQDGWAARRLRYMMPRGSGRIRISGTLPPWMNIDKQILDVRLGDSFTRFEIPPGDFSIELSPPSDLDSQVVPVEIISKKFLQISRIPGRGDRRRLAFLFKAIEWVDNTQPADTTAAVQH
jgi:hypothetical protein